MADEIALKAGWLKRQVASAAASAARDDLRRKKQAMDDALEKLDRAEAEWHEACREYDRLTETQS